MAIKGRKAIEKKAKKLETLTIEYVDVDSISPNTYNPNRQSEHDFELLLKSMTEDGITQPIIVQRSTRQIVDGEHRWRAAKQLGYSQIPVVFVDMTEEQMRIATLRHNRARGSEDIELTAALLRDLRELGALDWAQDSLMLDDVELQTLLEDVSAPEALAAEEYSEAWRPGEKGDDSDVASEQGQSIVHSTAAASTRQREVERRIAEAKTAEEREMAQREMTSIYRVSLVFTAEEADVVKAVLGDRPAEALVALCRDELERRKATQ